MQISVATDLKAFTKGLDKIQRQQLPFATSLALNQTAEFMAVNLNNDTRKYLDRPTPFTQRAFTIKRSSKRNLTALIFAKPAQAEYLKWQIKGGTRRPKGRAIPLPTTEPENIKLNRYGNMPRNVIKRLSARPDTFSGTMFGIAGLWQRGHYSKKGRFSTSSTKRGSNIRLLAAYEPSASYKPRFPYERLTKGYARSGFKPFFDKALARALRTAK